MKHCCDIYLTLISHLTQAVIYYQEEEAGAGQPEMSSSVTVDIEIIS